MPFEPEPGSKISYIGACIRKTTGSADNAWRNSIRPGKKIIYSSMGSQAMSFKTDCLFFFRKVIDIMRSPVMDGFHLVLAVSAELDAIGEWPALPQSVTILHWAPQMEILQEASVAVIHGGFGTVKECIFHGVPMVVLPLGRDQPWNARLVEQRKLGISGRLKDVSESHLIDLITHVLNDPAIRENIGNMQRYFRDEEQEQAGVPIVESLLERNTR